MLVRLKLTWKKYPSGKLIVTWDYSVRKGNAMDSYKCLFLSILIFVVKYIKSQNRKLLLPTIILDHKY